MAAPTGKGAASVSETGRLVIMYPSQQSQGDAAPSERRSNDQDLERDGFRPVALPALAAAVRIGAVAKQAARQAGSKSDSTRFLHEDAPLV